MGTLKFIDERLEDYNANEFLNELFMASKYLGVLEGKISRSYFWKRNCSIKIQRNKKQKALYGINRETFKR